MRYICFLFFSLLLFCAETAHAQKKSRQGKDPLAKIIRDNKATLGPALEEGKGYEVQIIYTQINRDAQGRPSFQSWTHNVDSTRYFYPASMVKMPLALLALEKMNRLKSGGYPQLNKNTPYRLDSLRPFQQRYDADSSSPTGQASIAHDIRKILVVSDNLAYNHLFEFLGREYINKTLHTKGYTRTGIMHRFNYAARENQFSSPIRFMSGSRAIFSEPEKEDKNIWINPQHSTLKGKGWMNAKDSLIKQPFDMSKKNWFALTDMEKMLRSVIFPDYVPEQQRFMLGKDDYRFLWHYMGIFPRECDYPSYDTTQYRDGYVKFFLFGDSKARQDGKVRVFNKVGEAYGTLTDVAYIVDFEHHVEFILAATILCNSDTVFNDNQYDYDTIGFPFLANLGKSVMEFERKRHRTVKPDLSKYWEALK